MPVMTHDFQAYDDYIGERTGTYEHHAVRYRATADFFSSLGLCADSTVYDVGSGWTDFDYTLRSEYDWLGRYIPIDGSISALDLNTWVPERPVEFTAALEIIEHLADPLRLVRELQAVTRTAMAISVPNPRTTDVLGMDRTHVTIVTPEMLESVGFHVEERTFYGGVYSKGEPDALFATWVA